MTSASTAAPYGRRGLKSFQLGYPDEERLAEAPEKETQMYIGIGTAIIIIILLIILL
jgi:hypothetical protein